MKIEQTTRNDIPALQQVLDATELFPSEMLPDMLGASLDNNQSPDIWLTCHQDGRAVGFCYAVPEQLAEGAWNMLAIAVAPDVQGAGYGKAIVAALEASLKAGTRVL